MGTIVAAPIGVVGAAVVLRSVIALPPTPQAGYNKELALGTVASGRDARQPHSAGDALGPGRAPSSGARCARPCADDLPHDHRAGLDLRLGHRDRERPWRANAMVFMLFLGATGFSYVFRALGGDDLMIATLARFGIDTKWEVLGFVMVLIFLLGSRCSPRSSPSSTSPSTSATARSSWPGSAPSSR